MPLAAQTPEDPLVMDSVILDNEETIHSNNANDPSSNEPRGRPKTLFCFEVYVQEVQRLPLDLLEFPPAFAVQFLDYAPLIIAPPTELDVTDRGDAWYGAGKRCLFEEDAEVMEAALRARPDSALMLLEIENSPERRVELYGSATVSLEGFSSTSAAATSTATASERGPVQTWGRLERVDAPLVTPRGNLGGMATLAVSLATFDDTLRPALPPATTRRCSRESLEEIDAIRSSQELLARLQAQLQAQRQNRRVSPDSPKTVERTGSTSSEHPTAALQQKRPMLRALLDYHQEEEEEEELLQEEEEEEEEEFQEEEEDDGVDVGEESMDSFNEMSSDEERLRAQQKENALRLLSPHTSRASTDSCSPPARRAQRLPAEQCVDLTIRMGKMTVADFDGPLQGALVAAIARVAEVPKDGAELLSWRSGSLVVDVRVRFGADAQRAAAFADRLSLKAPQHLVPRHLFGPYDILDVCSKCCMPRYHQPYYAPEDYDDDSFTSSATEEGEAGDRRAFSSSLEDAPPPLLKASNRASSWEQHRVPPPPLASPSSGGFSPRVAPPRTIESARGSEEYFCQRASPRDNTRNFEVFRGEAFIADDDALAECPPPLFHAAAARSPTDRRHTVSDMMSVARRRISSDSIRGAQQQQQQQPPQRKPLLRQQQRRSYGEAPAHLDRRPVSAATTNYPPRQQQQKFPVPPRLVRSSSTTSSTSSAAPQRRALRHHNHQEQPPRARPPVVAVAENGSPYYYYSKRSSQARPTTARGSTGTAKLRRDPAEPRWTTGDIVCENSFPEDSPHVQQQVAMDQRSRAPAPASHRVRRSSHGDSNPTLLRRSAPRYPEDDVVRSSLEDRYQDDRYRHHHQQQQPRQLQPPVVQQSAIEDEIADAFDQVQDRDGTATVLELRSVMRPGSRIALVLFERDAHRRVTFDDVCGAALSRGLLRA